MTLHNILTGGFYCKFKFPWFSYSTSLIYRSDSIHPCSHRSITFELFPFRSELLFYWRETDEKTVAPSKYKRKEYTQEAALGKKTQRQRKTMEWEMVKLWAECDHLLNLPQVKRSRPRSHAGQGCGLGFPTVTGVSLPGSQDLTPLSPDSFYMCTSSLPAASQATPERAQFYVPLYPPQCLATARHAVCLP